MARWLRQLKIPLPKFTPAAPSLLNRAYSALSSWLGLVPFPLAWRTNGSPSRASAGNGHSAVPQLRDPFMGLWPASQASLRTASRPLWARAFGDSSRPEGHRPKSAAPSNSKIGYASGSASPTPLGAFLPEAQSWGYATALRRAQRQSRWAFPPGAQGR